MRRGTNETRFTLAVVTAPRVAADRSSSAGVGKTLVEVHALSTHSLEAVFTEALSLDALGVVRAVEV